MSSDLNEISKESEVYSSLISSYKSPEEILKSTIRSNSNGYSNMEETDPDLICGFEIVDLPSRGKFRPGTPEKITIEYLTSIDEDILSSQSLIKEGTVLDTVLQRKIKDKINVADLLPGDTDALWIFLRASSYGSNYTVKVTDPRDGSQFESVIDLRKLKYKDIEEYPDQNGNFRTMLPSRKKEVYFRLLTCGELKTLELQQEAYKKAVRSSYSEHRTNLLKTSIISIGGNTDKTYIHRFVDAMPAMDSLHIRKEIMRVAPGVDMTHEFTTMDGFKFKATLNIGVDFYYPNL